MNKFKITTTICQPQEVVSKALKKPENLPCWTANLEKFEVIKGGPNEIGSIVHLHYLQNDSRYVMEDKLLYCEPGKKYISRVSGDQLIAVVETSLRSLGDKTEMSLKWFGKGKKFILKLLLPLIRNKIAKRSKKELEIFKGLVETRGSDFLPMENKR